MLFILFGGGFTSDDAIHPIGGGFTPDDVIHPIDGEQKSGGVISLICGVLKSRCFIRRVDYGQQGLRKEKKFNRAHSERYCFVKNVFQT
ncbi:unnamed protein product [Rotaria sordida]|uniref:Uncharacterized protein n=1 Tax=Rotaria sordida TaxID=392033 RepID=A0A814GKN4_9BILA|nr:unnamed protein product [Rotaria sordida]